MIVASIYNIAAADYYFSTGNQKEREGVVQKLLLLQYTQCTDTKWQVKNDKLCHPLLAGSNGSERAQKLCAECTSSRQLCVHSSRERQRCLAKVTHTATHSLTRPLLRCLYLHLPSSAGKGNEALECHTGSGSQTLCSGSSSSSRRQLITPLVNRVLLLLLLL